MAPFLVFQRLSRDVAKLIVYATGRLDVGGKNVKR